jgi:hypothetical protein
MADLAEARIAAEAALETGLSVIVSLVFDSGKNRDRTIMGSTPEQAATALTSGAHGVGANCGLGIRDFISVCGRLAAATPLPIWIEPNAGLPETWRCTKRLRWNSQLRRTSLLRRARCFWADVAARHRSSFACWRSNLSYRKRRARQFPKYISFTDPLVCDGMWMMLRIHRRTLPWRPASF